MTGQDKQSLLNLYYEFLNKIASWVYSAGYFCTKIFFVYVVISVYNIKAMQKINSFLINYSASVLRYGMSIVILWFAVAQFLNPVNFSAYVPDSVVTMLGVSAGTLVMFNAIFETVFGLMLVFGWKTRLSALLLSLHLFDIAWVVGYGEIGIRDFGLAIATFVIFMNGADYLCFDGKTEDLKISTNNNTNKKVLDLKRSLDESNINELTD